MGRFNSHNCQEIIKSIEIYLDGRLSQIEANNFLSQLKSCPRCNEKFEKEKSYKTFIKNKMPVAQAPNRLIAEIRSNIKRNNFRS